MVKHCSFAQLLSQALELVFEVQLELPVAASFRNLRSAHPRISEYAWPFQNSNHQ
jgi:hypothetical protein